MCKIRIYHLQPCGCLWERLQRCPEILNCLTRPAEIPREDYGPLRPDQLQCRCNMVIESDSDPVNPPRISPETQRLVQSMQDYRSRNPAPPQRDDPFDQFSRIEAATARFEDIRRSEFERHCLESIQRRPAELQRRAEAEVRRLVSEGAESRRTADLDRVSQRGREEADQSDGFPCVRAFILPVDGDTSSGSSRRHARDGGRERNGPRGRG